VLPADSFAAEATSEGRKLWKLIMRWVNFGILAFFIVKYGKAPLMKFLYGERDKIKAKLDEVNDEVSQSKALMDEESQKLKDIDVYIEQIRKDIIDMGNREKAAIIDEAKKSAQNMIKEAKKESDTRLGGAKKMLNDDLVEQAVELAKERLQEAFTDQDNENTINGFMGSLDDVKTTHEEALA
jgi:F-type H+-transporting ATPase subunit b